MAERVKYSEDQLKRYFDRVCIPEARRVYDVSKLGDHEQLVFLHLLSKHHLVKVPWENLAQHYSWHRTVYLKPAFLFNKIVENPGRGGYCMEVNFFFHLILYSLGFQVYMAGSRIYNPASKRFGGWTHVVNVVTIAGNRYLLDGGLGPQGPTYPVMLKHDVVGMQIAPANLRVMYENITNNVDTSQKVWVYQHRYNPDSPWVPMYCFTDLEFTPEDVESMNFAPWLNRKTFFTHKVVSVRFTTDKEVDSDAGPGSPDAAALEGDIDGSLTLNHDVLKWRRNGEKVVVLPFKTDSERVAALRKYFGVPLTDQDQEAIMNTAAQIGVRAMGADD